MRFCHDLSALTLISLALEVAETPQKLYTTSQGTDRFPALDLFVKVVGTL